jgi:hypothetical protein
MMPAGEGVVKWICRKNSDSFSISHDLSVEIKPTWSCSRDVGRKKAETPGATISKTVNHTGKKRLLFVSRYCQIKNTL